MAEVANKEANKKPRTSIPQFFREVGQERRKVTWPTRNETVATSIMVFIMVALASVFFFLADLGINQVIQMLINLGG